MSRGTTIGAQDVTPRHLRPGAEGGGSLTIPVGSSMADARRQLLLRTFASTDGDLIRTARLLGISAGEVETELMMIVRVGGGSGEDGRRGAPPASASPAGKGAARAAPPKAPVKAKGKPKGKGGRSR